MITTADLLKAIDKTAPALGRKRYLWPTSPKPSTT